MILCNGYSVCFVLFNDIDYEKPIGHIRKLQGDVVIQWNCDECDDY
jgi:hypothetical protein